MKNQNRRWAWWMLVLLFWTVSGVVLAQAAGERPELTAGHKKMLDWCGQYTITGKTFTSPLGPAHPVKGTWIAGPILNGFAIEGSYSFEGKGPNGETQGREIISYDPETDKYHYIFWGDTGYVDQAPFTQQGAVASWQTTSVMNGKKYHFRGTETDLPDGAGFVRREDYSTDGQTWQPLHESRFTIVTPAGDEQELIRVQQEWSRAEVAGDVRTVDRILADEYVLTLSDGTLLPKAAYLRDIQSEDTRSIAMSVEGTKVQLYGDIALAKGIVKWTEPGGKKHEDLFSEVWQKRDGRWQCLATHESEVEQTVDSAKLSDEMKKLAVFAGEWTYEGEQTAPPVPGLPYGGAGRFHGTSTCRFVLGGRFLEQRIEDHNPSGTTTSVGLEGYDPRAENYVSIAFVSDGSRDISTETVSADGRTWTTKTTMTTSAGQTVPVRSVTTISPDGMHQTSTTEVSPDGGKTWKHWYKDESHKVKE